MLYFAYGMNTNPQEMALRCPGARSLGHAQLVNHSFRFAQHADVEPCEGSYVDGVLWEINEDNLKALDNLEGYPYYYNRVVATVMHESRAYHALVYRMQPGHEINEPTLGYYRLITEGYRAHGVPIDQLENSLNYTALATE
jgi:gamma-glutamylcyclotransferase (GGCT)/AIG2-like uncharacterized protein YtfP